MDFFFFFNSMEIDVNRVLLEKKKRLVILQEDTRKETKKKNQVTLEK